ncbi:hypothetical protein OPV22_019739 [Ensete ventricosum]|uniref:Uncharacterized protein n=1 Tax=Ensete ventricosum TaxID=4639 RepID=A0AAV8QJW2_ENSVE|nr:hypothetical protein OPV22_019739 [Ensete ventricosum]RWW28662.1 hypothetical protein GW17_00006854 [Ensete ventricosum]RWW72422.1 hypothetical protein BHE74_00019784 [Ensete ventricosum]RZS04048.1 hypothetical protein BHM03_00034322 [Ensete ventricosum]
MWEQGWLPGTSRVADDVRCTHVMGILVRADDAFTRPRCRHSGPPVVDAAVTGGCRSRSEVCVDAKDAYLDGRASLS